jgi:molybdate transport system regulatory protein
VSRILIELPNRQVGALGPRSVRILELVKETGSISASAKAMNISYCHACQLLLEAENTFGAPVTERRAGGAQGGGPSLTRLGGNIVKHYRTIESQATRAIRTKLAALRRLQKR